MKRLLQFAAMLLIFPCCMRTQTTMTGVSVQGMTVGTGGAIPQPITSVPDALVGAPYTIRLAAYATDLHSFANLAAMSSWSIVTGALPTGLSLDGTTGIIKGTPTLPGPSTVTFRGTATSGGSATQAITFNVVSPPARPELPQVWLDTSYPDTTGYVTRTVCASGCDYTNTQLQTAFNNVSLDGGSTAGEIIELQSGFDYVGNFSLPAYTMTAGKWVIITTNTSPSNLPAEGVRTDPSYSGTLAKITTNTSGYALGFKSQANHYRLANLEIEVASAVTNNFGIVVIGCESGTCETTLASQPSYIYIDRCYIHGNNDANDIRRGISFNAPYLAAVDSYISDITNHDTDCQAIGSWNGNGPYKIDNNFMESATESFLFGGNDSSISNIVPSDIQITRNYMFKPLTWWPSSPTYGGHFQSIKNHFELKNGQRVYAMGNVLENNWLGSQTGFSVLMKSEIGSSSPDTWTVVQDVNFVYNMLKNVGEGYNIAAAPIGPAIPLNHVTVKNNLNVNVGSPYGDGKPYLFGNNSNGDPTDVVINHNTNIGASSTWALIGDLQDGTVSPFAMINDIALYGTYGFFGSGSSSGTASLNAYCGVGAYTFTANIMMRPAGNPGNHPAGNFFPTDWTAVYDDYANADYHVQTASPYHNAGTDGKDIGADIDAVLASTYGVN